MNETTKQKERNDSNIPEHEMIDRVMFTVLPKRPRFFLPLLLLFIYYCYQFIQYKKQQLHIITFDPLRFYVFSNKSIVLIFVRNRSLDSI